MWGKREGNGKRGRLDMRWNDPKKEAVGINLQS